MPWTGSQFASRHNHSLHGEKAEHASRIANAVLRSGAPEGESIAVANKWAQRRGEGGGITDTYDNQNSPTVSRDLDGELLSEGRRQGRDVDNNLTPVPDRQQTHGERGQPIPQRPNAGWMPQPIPRADPINGPKDQPWMHQAARGGGIRRDVGGGILDPSAGPGGLVPTAANQNPLQQNALQTYANMDQEKLQETLARLGGPASPQGALVARVLRQKQMQPQPLPVQQQQQQQTQPTGQQFKRGGAMKRADGGDMGISASQGTPWWSRAEARSADTTGGGFLHGSTPGRADSVQTTAPGGSYVLPADLIAGLGEGNSLAGARAVSDALSTGPHGVSLPRGGGGHGPPRPPPAYREAKGGTIPIFQEKRAAGGVSGAQQTPVLLSHGESVLTPEECRRVGRGQHRFFMTPKGTKILEGDRRKGLLVKRDDEADRKRGHAILDEFVVHQRAKQVKKIKSLPPPVKPK